MKYIPEILLIIGFIATVAGVFLSYGLACSLMFAGGFLIVLALLIRLTGNN